MKIKSIKAAGIEPVYDLYVDEYHNFISNGGVVLHNCDSLRYWCVMHTAVPKEPDTRTSEQKMLDEHKKKVLGRQTGGRRIIR